jgi:acyl-CoA thioesterase FadM
VVRGEAVLVEGRVVLACVDMKEERIASMPERILTACAR